MRKTESETQNPWCLIIRLQFTDFDTWTLQTCSILFVLFSPALSSSQFVVWFVVFYVYICFCPTLSHNHTLPPHSQAIRSWSRPRKHSPTPSTCVCARLHSKWFATSASSANATFSMRWTRTRMMYDHSAWGSILFFHVMIWFVLLCCTSDMLV